MSSSYPDPIVHLTMRDDGCDLRVFVSESLTISRAWIGLSTGSASIGAHLPPADARRLGEALIAAADACGPVVLQKAAA